MTRGGTAHFLRFNPGTPFAEAEQMGLRPVLRGGPPRVTPGMADTDQAVSERPTNPGTECSSAAGGRDRAERPAPDSPPRIDPDRLAAIEDLTAAAALGCDAMAAGVSLPGPNGVIWLATHGVPTRTMGMPDAFLPLVDPAAGTLIIADVVADPRTSHRRAAGSDPQFRGYAARPIRHAGGNGALWVAFDHPHVLDERHIAMLGRLAERIGAELAAGRPDSNADPGQRSHDQVEARESFLANLSHELRTPMNAILGYASVLCDDVPGPRREDAGRSLRRQGRHMLSILDDLLELAETRSGRIEPAWTPFDPIALVEELVHQFRARAEHAGIGLNITWAGPMPDIVLSDPVRIRKMLTNIVGNAIRFTERGSVTLEIHHCDATEPGGGTASDLMRVAGPDSHFGLLTIDVVDTGIGIAVEDIPQLFEPFTQHDESLTRRHGGVGLGLTVSQRLARLIGGEITAHRNPDHGSRFTVSIPAPMPRGVERNEVQAVDRGLDHGDLGPTPTGRSRPDAPIGPAGKSLEDFGVFESVAGDTAGSITGTAGVPAAVSGPLAGWRILVVEDGTDDQQLAQHHLRRAGATVEVAANGAEGIHAAKRAFEHGRLYDLILMDMQMPGLDGFAASMRLRADGYDGAIVAMTAHAMSGDRERCLVAGCDGYASKPIDRDGLIAVCRRHGRRRSAHAA